MTISDGPDVITLEMQAAVLALTPYGRPVRIEPVTPTRMPPVARWRVARQHQEDARQFVLAVVPEIEGRIECGSRSSNQ